MINGAITPVDANWDKVLVSEAPIGSFELWICKLCQATIHPSRAAGHRSYSHGLGV